MARDGMSNLIMRLRRLVDDSESAVWLDDELRDVLDEHSTPVYREQLAREKTRTSSTSYEYKIFHSRNGNYEEGGTAYFQIEDSAGEQRGTADYSVDYIRGIVTMDADQGGTALYLTGTSYDINGAAAQCWREAATIKAGLYDFKAGDHTVSRSQWFEHCMAAANMLAMQSRPVTVRPWTSGEYRNE